MWQFSVLESYILKCVRGMVLSCRAADSLEIIIVHIQNLLDHIQNWCSGDTSSTLYIGQMRVGVCGWTRPVHAPVGGFVSRGLHPWRPLGHVFPTALDLNGRFVFYV